MDDIRIHAIHRVLESRRPRVYEGPPEVARAAVALVLRPTPADLEILLIERPRSERDPWSGHMAFPGGRRERGEGLLHTAVRETREEVGIDLEAGGMMIGRLDEVQPRPRGPQIAVAPFVFAVPDTTAVIPDPAEVAATVWIPLGHMTDPAAAAEHLHVLPGGAELPFPAISYHHHVIWGLTYTMLIQFLALARAARTDEPS